MPELPEVEASRRLLETNLGGLKVTAVGALEAGGHARAGEFDSIVMDDADASADNFIKSLKGKTLVAVHRKGKQMWLEMSAATPSCALWNDRKLRDQRHRRANVSGV